MPKRALLAGLSILALTACTTVGPDFQRPDAPGVASYAIVSGSQALVYDTHISVDHAKAIRAHRNSSSPSKMI